MNDIVPSTYDFPYGYPSFESMRKEAFNILKDGRYLYHFGGGRPEIRIEGLRVKSNLPQNQSSKELNIEEESHFFFPIIELLGEGKISIDEVKQRVLNSFQELAQEAIKFAYTKPADHIPYTFLLAWGIANGVYKEGQLKRIRFDHGDGSGAYHGEQYVTCYGEQFVEKVVDWVVDEITNPTKIEARIAKEKQETSSRLLQQQTSGKVYECWCEGCPV